MNMKKIILFSATIFVFSIMTSCGFIESRIARFTTDFKVWPSDNRILYENGAESLASEIAGELPLTIGNIETRQYGTFKEPVKIYAFATAKSFAKYSGVSEVVKGAALDNEVFLSGQLLQKLNEVHGMLGHELSHIQLCQTLGTIRFNRTLPRWFREGLAIYVSDGGGATNATEAESREHFFKGEHFSPETKGALLNQGLPASKGLEPKVFYRQSGMFVRYMAANHPEQFMKFLQGLQEGKPFEPYFTECFGFKVGEMLQTFIRALK
jgi:hypothetical protein